VSAERHQFVDGLHHLALSVYLFEMAAFRTIKDNVEGPIWGAVLTSASQPQDRRLVKFEAIPKQQFRVD
jgi:hypothetical protein